MFSTFVFGAALAVVLIAFGLRRSQKSLQNGLTAALLTTVLLGTLAQPALAGAVQGDALSADQKDLNETLLTTPHKNQYQGIEYADVKGTPLSDREITNRVEDSAPEGIKVSVSNGSVRLSGKLADRRTAQAVIDEVKAIPGVHEVAYDLGLNTMPDQQ